MEPEGSSPCSQDPATVPILSQIPEPCFPKNHFNIILPCTPSSSDWSLPFRLSIQNFVRVSHSPHACYMTSLSHPPWFYHPNNIWWRVQTVGLFIRFSPTSCHFIPLRSKYSPKHPAPKHSCSFPNVCVSSFDLIKTMYKTTRQSKEEKLKVITRIIHNVLSTWE
jgi:hypothetical protein